ncbi:hypothetical protein MUK70_14845 [Dyadobacter chenwenxiniae]|uniref:Uncharacterized protein n=1 Tax=Dyadobacter chenwenxiniae TaxID=2906456 RepID=A0A9X1TDM3_9BACT|nr:hypothetical protein [Dyadobacter chenwenxiniae]MCF0060520.1 hypothetical protein [Dyadobacter chenwenxiniae]UON86252.1 hypothetical protein MUK70_14845 [Dyadobacter chenwenxiniae]
METLERNFTVTEIENNVLAMQQKLMQLTQSKLVIMGNEYHLWEWITLSDYSKKYNIKIPRLLNWIVRGVIPNDSVIVVPELNHLKLIKNQQYEARSYPPREVKNKH